MNDLERFEKKFIEDENGCWLWQGTVLDLSADDSYGRFKANGSQWLAHRFAWTLYRGDIPEGKCVLHSCDVRRCVNPSHLFLGTVLENNLDCIRKGRYTYLRGEANPAAKLTWEEVQEMRDLYKKGWTGLEISEKFGVSQSHAYRVLWGKCWKDQKSLSGSKTG